MNNLLSISDARKDLANLVNKVSNGLERVVITVNEKPKAVLISTEELESYEETVEVLFIPEAFEAIQKGAGQIKKGQFVSLSDIR